MTFLVLFYLFIINYDQFNVKNEKNILIT